MLNLRHSKLDDYGDEAAVPKSPREWRAIWLCTWLLSTLIFGWLAWFEVRWWGANVEPGAISKVMDSEGYTISKHWEISPVGKLVTYQFGPWNQPVIGKQYVSRYDEFKLKQHVEIEYLGTGASMESRIQGTGFTFFVWCFVLCCIYFLRQCLWFYTHPVTNEEKPLEDREIFKHQQKTKKSGSKNKNFDIHPS